MFERTVHVVGNGVGVGVLGYETHLEATQHFQNATVGTGLTLHVLIEHLNGKHAFVTRDDLYLRLLTDVVAGDQGTGVLRLEGVHHPQRNLVLTHALASARVDRFHTEVRQLVSNVIVGAPQGDDLIRTDNVGVRGTEVVFLVDDRFAGVGNHRDPAEGHLAVAPVEGTHQAFLALGIPRHDRQLTAQVHRVECLLELFIQRQQFIVAPPGQVHEPRIDAFLLKLQGSVEGTVGLTDTGQHFTSRQQMLLKLELPVGTQTLQINQAAANAFDAVSDELVRLLLEHGVREQLAIDVGQELDQFGEVVAPGPVRLGIGEQGIDTRFSGFLVLQQFVGDTAIGGDHEDALVQVVLGAPAENDVVAHRLIIAHGGAADFLYGMLFASHNVTVVILQNECREMAGVSGRLAHSLLHDFVHALT